MDCLLFINSSIGYTVIFPLRIFAITFLVKLHAAKRQGLPAKIPCLLPNMLCQPLVTFPNPILAPSCGKEYVQLFYLQQLYPAI